VRFFSLLTLQCTVHTNINIAYQLVVILSDLRNNRHVEFFYRSHYTSK